jgi:hypothetical protein
VARDDRLLWLARPRVAAGVVAAVWTAAEILHAAHMSAVYLGLVTAAAAAVCGWASSSREAAGWAVAAGGWLTLAAAAGPAAGPYCAVTLLGLGVAATGWWRLNRHGAVQSAKTQRRHRAVWLSRAHRFGLGGSHLLHHEETRLGHVIRANTTGTGRRASSLAAGSDVAERVAEYLKLPVSRVQVSKADLAGEIVIHVREKDPWEHPIPHPLTVDKHEITLPVPSTVRKPVVVGQDPDSGRPLRLTLWDSHGGKTVMVVGKKDAGKTTILSDVKERVTACGDALLVTINLSKCIEDVEWSPACHMSALGPKQTRKALTILDWLCRLVDERMMTPRDDAVFQPTPADPCVVVVLDEVDTLAKVPGAQERLEHIASKHRSEGVVLVFAGQRGTAAWVGGSNVRAMADIVCIGRVRSQSEAQHAAGDLQIPDMSAYGEAHSGVWLIGEAEAGGRFTTGRAFNLSDLRQIREIAYARRRDDAPVPVPAAGAGVGAERPAPPPPGDLSRYDSTYGPLEDALADGDRAALAELDARRVKLAGAAEETGKLEADLTEALGGMSDDQLKAGAEQSWADLAGGTVVPDGARTKILNLCAGEGASGRALVDHLGEKRWRVMEWLNRLRFEGLIVSVGRGPQARWRLTAGPES